MTGEQQAEKQGPEPGDRAAKAEAEVERLTAALADERRAVAEEIAKAIEAEKILVECRPRETLVFALTAAIAREIGNRPRPDAAGSEAGR